MFLKVRLIQGLKRPKPPINVEGVEITSAKSTTITVGDSGSVQLTYSITPSDADNTSVTFETDSTEGINVSTTGLITYTSILPVGSYTTIIKTVDGNFTDSHVLVVEEDEELEG